MEPDRMDVDDESTKETQKRLMKKYNITFDGPANLDKDGLYPENCRAVFKHVTELGDTNYQQYHHNVTADSLHHPWRHQVRNRADRIADIARRCIESRKNENSWRLEIEHEIMARFSVEVACKKCRGRLWRSEKEVIVNDTISEAAKSLQDRQKNRKACRCGSGDLNDGIYDQGLNALFDNKADEAIKYPRQLQQERPKGKKPDRVYGLRVTDRFNRLLSRMTENTLKISPFRIEGEALIFPFLVLEVKSEKGTDGFTDMEDQTGFAIRELLRLQDNLAKAVDASSAWDGGPLVWFLSCKGEQWRVSGAYIDRKHAKRHYRVVRLWNGSIDDRRDALRLLLILDYIVDWARDIYREAIAQSLRKLITHDSRSLSYDPDILSMAGNRAGNKLHRETQARSDNMGDLAAMSRFDALRIFDNPFGKFRDARFIWTGFRALYIDSDNFVELIRSYPSDKAARKFAQDLVSILQDCCRVKKHMLDSLEAAWTDTERYGSDMTPPDEPFFAGFFAFSYTNSDWQLVRQLGYVAIAEVLIGNLQIVSGIFPPISYLQPQIPTMHTMPSFQDILQRNVTENLSACLSNECIYTEQFEDGTGDLRTSFASILMENSNTGDLPQRKVVLKRGMISQALVLVDRVYLRHKIGINEPRASFLRLSSQLDELGPRAKSPQNPASQHASFWTPIWRAEVPDLHIQGIVFSYRKNPLRPGLLPDCCIFIVDPEKVIGGLNADLFRSLVRHKFECLTTARNVDGFMDPSAVHDCVDGIVYELQRMHRGLCYRGTDCPNLMRNLDGNPVKKTLWDILTKEGVSYNSLQQFEFTANMPFRRLNQLDPNSMDNLLAHFHRIPGR